MIKNSVLLPTELHKYQPQSFSLSDTELKGGQLEILRTNVEIVRDTIIFVTALAGAKGLGGHTGGPFDIAPEFLIVEGFVNGGQAVDRVLFDDAGHRVAILYVLATLRGELDPEALLHYREGHWKLPGHPEKGLTPGVHFSSGRLGHMWSFVNGVARRYPDRAICLFSSDGSQQEGNCAEAARIAVQQRYNVKLVVDDNDVTISGKPSNYLGTFDLKRTFEGHGLPVAVADGDDLPSIYAAVRSAFSTPGPQVVLIKRKIARGVPNIEGQSAAHDVVKVADAINYFDIRGNAAATELIKQTQKVISPERYYHPVASKKTQKNRDVFGLVIADILRARPRAKLTNEILVVDSDLEGSCGLHHIREAFPEVYVESGVMERANFSLAAGFGSRDGAQGVFGTFAAFAEMIISEVTMARLNQSNVICHFSHSGVDDIADNTCHFGVNNMFLDAGFGEFDTTQLYFPADEGQLRAILWKIFDQKGMRVVMSTRSAVPAVWDSAGGAFFGPDYVFIPGRDDIVRNGSLAWVVSYGDMLHRCLDAVDKLREEGFDIGLVNKVHLNCIDDACVAKIANSKFVALFETQNRKTGLGVRYGAAMLERGFRPTYRHYGVTKAGTGGLGEQIVHQELDSRSVYDRCKELLEQT